ncbi:hypothetical protein [Microbacterium sp. NPDC056736]|uniref:hypothetical protein n=1 Tax=Microbacterium sp. NPDC056736 TaxID=3345932 RepID=UPI00366D83D0
MADTFHRSGAERKAAQRGVELASGMPCNPVRTGAILGTRYIGFTKATVLGGVVMSKKDNYRGGES